MREPAKLWVDMGDDPEVRAYIQHCYSIQGMQGDAPPPLSDEQLEKVDAICQAIEEKMKDTSLHTWTNVTEYLKRHVTLISGLFCGGTTYATRFLRACGLKASHEQIFSADNNFYLKSMIATQQDVEISGGIPPWIASLKGSDIRYLTLVRHPVELVNSRFHFRSGQASSKLEDRPTNDTLGIQRDILTQFELNMLAMIPEYIWRIESLEDQVDVLKMFGKWKGLSPERLAKARSSDRNSSSGKKPRVCEWDNLIKPLKDWAHDLNYKPDGGVK